MAEYFAPSFERELAGKMATRGLINAYLKRGRPARRVQVVEERGGVLIYAEGMADPERRAIESLRAFGISFRVFADVFDHATDLAKRIDRFEAGRR